MKFKIKSNFQPTGDQPQAIKKLVDGINVGKENLTLLGVTGSGKTFTMANVINKLQKPTLIIAHNKTLAGQLYQEFRDFFPHNAVSYFVSYYDYYQPEAYIPSTDTYIQKEATINDEIDKLRLSSTTNLLTRPDSIVIASVSCIYNLGNPIEYAKQKLHLLVGQVISFDTLLLSLQSLAYQRSNIEFKRGTYRVKGDVIQLWPAYEEKALRVETLDNRIVDISWIDPVSGNKSMPNNISIHKTYNPQNQRFTIYPAKHYTINPNSRATDIEHIKQDLEKRVEELERQNKKLESYRLRQKVNYDLQQIQEFGFVNGIENYSRYFDGRKENDPPFTLIDYFNENIKQFNLSSFLTIIDESHITLPQIKGMYLGDRARKKTLIDYGFRLPSALDNRPLKINEFLNKTKVKIFISATPKETEIQLSKNTVIEQLIRPTGLLEPTIELRPTAKQIEDLVVEIIKRKQDNQRTLVTTLTKKMAEALTDYLNDHEKIDELIQSYLQKQRLTNQQVSKINNNQSLPIKQIEIGKISSKYFNHLSDQTTKLNLDNLKYPQVAYLHSDIDTLERADILEDLRKGKYDCVVGINLLREGLDLPEVSLVAILDADKEGFLRSTTALIQTMGRGARHIKGHSILYADYLTKSMKQAITEILRRRKIQQDYNQRNNIVPTSIIKPIRERMIKKIVKDKEQKKSSGITIQLNKKEKLNLTDIDPQALTPDDKLKLTKKLKTRMQLAVKDMDFELAAIIRDTIKTLKSK